MKDPGAREELRARNEALRVQIDDMLDDLHRRSDLLSRAQSEVAALRVETRTPDGLARVSVDSAGAIVEVDIAPEAFARTTPSRLGEAIAAAARDAAATARLRVQELMAPVSRTDFDLPDLPDLIPGAPSLRDLVPVVLAPESRPDGPGWEPGASVLRGADE
ncbi:YbaB/EbfC family nucleoid-associated protein [Rhodococcus sp. NPDC058481]|uniref:YbaB/EbfC family nucleoid-associated protein n=1 Tax=unclassified Rhodococcus (in: high G+C Gram-positive bacteria) TaxID=192944 RepID=UPI00364D8682